MVSNIIGPHLSARVQPRTLVLDRVAASAEGLVSCEASSFSRPSFQTKRGHIELRVVSLPSKTPPGSDSLLFVLILVNWYSLEVCEYL